MFADIDCLIFDVDNTLWDFDGAARKTVADYLSTLGLCADDTACDRFVELAYETWREYEQGLLARESLGVVRFDRLLKELDAWAPGRPEAAGAYFIRHYIDAFAPMPGARCAVRALDGPYRLGVLSSGFRAQRKLEGLGILQHFEFVLTPKDTGFEKTSPRAFAAAARRAGVSPERCAYIGDQYLTDVLCAKAAGLKAIWVSGEAPPAGGQAPDAQVSTPGALVDLLLQQPF